MFWEIENIPQDRIALIDDVSGENISYGKLKEECDKFALRIKSEKKRLIFLFCDNTVDCVIAYLSALRSGHAVFLVNARMDAELKNSLIDVYHPEVIISIEQMSSLSRNYKLDKTGAKQFLYFNSENKKEVHKDIAVLLSTSGTTGSPKLVKLTHKNIQANASSIAEYLGIDENEKPITSLPMSYSFGLSVINSHLMKGATILCTNKSMVMREFWNTFNQHKCTSFSGVPYNYQMLQRLKFDKMEIPSLKTMAQAGGRLSEEFIRFFYEVAKKKNIKFFVMYGQTEATARISYVPFNELGDKIGSIGIPVPGGEIKIFLDGHEINTPKVEGELVYQGPNVMMGYAETREDLAKDDELHGVLHTGDIAYKDEDGFAYITGRLKRFIKLFGLRVNLDEIEKMIENHFAFAAACYGTDDALKILIQSSGNSDAELVKHKVIETYKLHHSVVKVKCVGAIPVTSSGKRDYKAIQEMDI